VYSKQPYVSKFVGDLLQIAGFLTVLQFPPRLLFQWASTVKIQLGVLDWYKADLIIISLKIILFSPSHGWKIAKLVLNNNHSLTDIEYSHKVVLSTPFDLTTLVVIDIDYIGSCISIYLSIATTTASSVILRIEK
jgi:hypothetical protein